MTDKVTLGGERLGSGQDMKVDLKQYSRSTHDLSYVWRSTMASGTLVPFMSEVALPGDTFDIKLNADMLTHPTVGPLFGTYKYQMDVFQVPIRLYNKKLHNNMLGIGLDMKSVILPKLELTATQQTETTDDPANLQINPSSLLAYLNIRGVGLNDSTNTGVTRKFNGVPFLGYWEIYKNYYANKQEKVGKYLFNVPTEITDNITTVKKGAASLPFTLTAKPTVNTLTITKTTGDNLDLTQYFLQTDIGDIRFSDVGEVRAESPTTATVNVLINTTTELTGIRIAKQSELLPQEIKIQTFDLAQIDEMRRLILSTESEFIINGSYHPGAIIYDSPYYALLKVTDFPPVTPYTQTQQGLALKTYQSDLFNNWLNTADIDQITTQTSIDVSGPITIDQINIANKIYNLLNAISTSGGSYDDWLKAVYNAERIKQAESPIYCGSLIKELIFQEINSTTSTETQEGIKPLGTLAGKGRLSQKHKGGNIVIHVDEPSYIMGIVSLTPRIDYSQGNKWDVNLDTLDDLHKPALDQIGFQELITEQLAWFGTYYENYPGQEGWKTRSAGKQPSWINYMTNVNQIRGNFAIKNNEMFMTLNRDYQQNLAGRDIADVTTYIDPAKFNQTFAETSRDSQNFWAQIAVNLEVRRKISARQIPQL